MLLKLIYKLYKIFRENGNKYLNKLNHKNKKVID